MRQGRRRTVVPALSCSASMARFLFASMPSAGHTNPLKPIARALAARGTPSTGTPDCACDTGSSRPVPRSCRCTRRLDQHGETFNDDHPGRAGAPGSPGSSGTSSTCSSTPSRARSPSCTRSSPGSATTRSSPTWASSAPSAFHELTGAPWVSVGISPLPVPSRDTAPFGTALPPSAPFAGRLRNRALSRALMDRVPAPRRAAALEAIRARDRAAPDARVALLQHLPHAAPAERGRPRSAGAGWGRRSRERRRGRRRQLEAGRGSPPSAAARRGG